MMRPIALSSLASRYGLELRGPDVEVSTLGGLTAEPDIARMQLAYAIAPEFVRQFLEAGLAACILPEEMGTHVGPDRSVLLTRGDPQDVFYSILAASAREGAWEVLEAQCGPETHIAPTAVVYDNVSIGRGAVIMDHVVLFPNTRIGDRVVVKPNTTIGGEGFEVKVIEGRRRIVSHVGGVWIEDDVEIGSSTCIDRGLFGDFTYIGRETKVDNLVHVAHSVRVGAGSTLIACSELSGSVVLEEGVWIGPNASVNQGLNLGAHCYIGTGSVVTRSLPPHSLAYGSPARIGGQVCACRGKLSFVDSAARCGRCGLAYQLVDGAVVAVST
jgi:UDP-3-O-[3-hydroxymyristoyl] glucosamine N-acyltransferase